MSKILLFPAGMPESLVQFKGNGAGVKGVGASSLVNDPARLLYPSWAQLPYITDPNFETSFLQLVNCPAPL
ncbi:MAG: hypothetical protein ACOYNL_05815 [Rickettsiales bacterium]